MKSRRPNGWEPPRGDRGLAGAIIARWTRVEPYPGDIPEGHSSEGPLMDRRPIHRDQMIHTQESRGRAHSFTRVHSVVLALVVVLGVIAAAFGAWRRFITVDGLAYLDVADAYLDEGWAAGTNGYWGSLYPLLLAAAFAVFRPALENELILVKVVHLGMYLMTLAAFIFFWREVDRLRVDATDADAASDVGAHADEGRSPHPGPHPPGVMPTWAFWGIGYTLFLWCTLRLIRVWTMSPDMLVMAAVLLAGGFLLRIRARPRAWWPVVGLGVALGFGYMAKAAMFPLAFVFLAGAAGYLGLSRAGGARLLVAFLLFAVLASPYLVTLSLQKERFTFGDSGHLNYARYVNGVPDIHWQGEIPGNGEPVHPTRQIGESPDAFEFAYPVGGTYPPWYDPSYWYEGVEVRFDPLQQLSAFARTGQEYTERILKRQGAAIAALFLLLMAMGPNRSFGLRGLARLWPIWLPAGAAIGMYSIVYVEMRYLTGFLVLAWGAGLAVLRLPDRPERRYLLNGAGGLMILVFALNLLIPNARALGSLLEDPQPRTATAWFDHGTRGSMANLPVARELANLGVSEGDGVAFVGYGYYSYWARLAGVRVIAEVPEREAVLFWDGDEEVRRRTVDTLLGTGAVALVTEVPGWHPAPEGWARLGETAYYVVLAGGDWE